MPTVDSLDIQISASAKTADEALDKLINTLGRVSASLGSVNFSGFANGVKTLSGAMQGLQNVKMPDYTRLAKGIEKISGLDSVQIAAAGQSMKELAGSLRFLDSVNVTENSKQISELAKGISQLGYTSSTKAIENIPKLATAMKQLMAELSKAPKVSQNLIDMTNALAKLARTGASSGKAASSLAKSLDTYTASTSRASKGSFSLAGAMTKLYSVYFLVTRAFNAFSGSIEIASDLEEVQNVINVTFGEYKHLIEDMSKTSIADFGMSELTTKQIASRFQAMGTAMGFAQDKMASMSVELTQLTVDMASFYNVEQEAMATSLQSIFTGETEPLRKYGLDLSQATLQQWAMTQGLRVNMQTMSQAEKTMLRYQYVLANTSAAQGDFARTSQSWANQIRILRQNFEALGVVVGKTLINALRPLVQALNNAMSHVIAFAETISNALGKIFGWKFEVTTGGGLTDDFAGAADASTDISGGLEDAEQAAKKLKTHLLGIDELNVVEPDIDTGAGITGGGGLGDLGGAAGAGDGEWVKTDTIFKDFESEIDSLYELGKYIGKVLTDLLNSIDWEKVYEGARNFGTGLADFLNGLISPELFGAVGRTIAGALNAAIYAALAFGERFDFRNFGLSIAEGINEFFKTFDFKSAAEAINVWAKGLLDTVITALDKIEWYTIGVKIGEFLLEIDFLEIGKKIGEAIWKAINAGFELFEGMFETAPIETALLAISGLTKLLKTDKVKKFITAIKNGIGTIQTFGGALLGNSTALITLQKDMPNVAGAIEVLTQSFANFRFGIENGNFLTGLSEGFKTIQNSMTGLQKGIVGVVAGFAEFAVLKDSISDIITGTGSLAVNIAEIGVAVAAAGVAFSTVFGFPAGLIATAIVGVIGALAGIKTGLDEIQAEKTGQIIHDALTSPGGVSILEISNSYATMANEISAQFDFINQKSQELSVSRESIASTTDEIDTYIFAIQNGADVTDSSVTEINNHFQRLLTESSSLLEDEANIIYSALAGSLGEAVVAAGGSIEEYIAITNQLKTDTQLALEELSASISSLSEEFSSGAIGSDEYASRIAGLYERYNELTGVGKETESMLSNVNDLVSAGINWEAVTYPDGTLNVSALTSEIESVSTAFLDAKGAIETGAEETMLALESLYDAAVFSGDTEAQTAIMELMQRQEEDLNESIAELESLASEYTLTLQEDLLNRIPEIVNGVEEPNWGRALFGATLEGDVQNAISEFETNWINPVEEAIESNFTTLGESGKTIASTAMGNIMDGLFEYDTGTLSGSTRTGTLRKTITSDVEGAVAGGIEDAKVEIGLSASSVGEDINKGIEKGINDNIGIVEDAATSIGDQAIEATKTALDSHSPSREYKSIGSDVVAGFNQGIAENTQSTINAIQSWMDSIKSVFTPELWAENLNGLLEGFKLKWEEIKTWWNEEAMTLWWEESVMPWFSFEKWYELLTGIQEGFLLKWEEITTWWREEAILTWWEEDVATWFTVEKWSELLENVKISFSTKWEEIVKQWRKNIDLWWNKDVIVWFTVERWSTLLKNVETAFETSFTEVRNIVDGKMVETYEIVAEYVDKMVSKIGEIASALSSLSSVNISGGVSFGIGATGYATGGFPEPASLFWAGEGGVPELMGTVGGRTAVAGGAEITGIREAVYDSGNVQAQLLNTAIELLQIIAEKDMSVNFDGREMVAFTDERRERNGWSFT